MNVPMSANIKKTAYKAMPAQQRIEEIEEGIERV